jgi:hypothetical protein
MKALQMASEVSAHRSFRHMIRAMKDALKTFFDFADVGVLIYDPGSKPITLFNPYLYSEIAPFLP